MIARDGHVEHLVVGRLAIPPIYKPVVAPLDGSDPAPWLHDAAVIPFTTAAPDLPFPLPAREANGLKAPSLAAPESHRLVLWRRLRQTSSAPWHREAHQREEEARSCA